MMLKREKRGTTEKTVSRNSINCEKSRKKEKRKEQLKSEDTAIARDKRRDWQILDSGGIA